MTSIGIIDKWEALLDLSKQMTFLKRQKIFLKNRQEYLSKGHLDYLGISMQQDYFNPDRYKVSIQIYKVSTFFPDRSFKYITVINKG